MMTDSLPVWVSRRGVSGGMGGGMIGPWSPVNSGGGMIEGLVNYGGIVWTESPELFC